MSCGKLQTVMVPADDRSLRISNASWSSSSVMPTRRPSWVEYCRIWKRAIPEKSQSPSSALTRPFVPAPKRRPLPNGSSHSQLALNECGMSVLLRKTGSIRTDRTAAGRNVNADCVLFAQV